MNGNTSESHQPLYPNLAAHTDKPEETISLPSSSSTLASPPNGLETPFPPQPEPVPSSYPPPPAYDDTATEKWGTQVMGAPAVPTCHPNNQKAALWTAGDTDHLQQQHSHHSPYIQYTPIEKKPTASPMESVLHKFNSWSSKADSTAHNIWHNLKTGSSVSGSAWGKMNLTAKALTGGGFEPLYKQTFTTFDYEKLKKTFACYLSTSTGPVAGTLYLSNVHVAFCSDLPLSFTAPSGQEAWSYYKVMVPLDKICTFNPVTMKENPSEKYLQIVTIDGHDFWFMGFVNYDKASHHLFDSIWSSAAPGIPVQPPVNKQ
ncbi:hypothetical protein RJ640_028185 [Escallonia rubra]|uniref:GRAM domain-containing protein n=1 Tax=Escallonia rubra TaxID=112253 RepID=A0AA88UB74_9ASTE|nr:hypothetical protein RJ640_028185 [Escallonia rubra]